MLGSPGGELSLQVRLEGCFPVPSLGCICNRCFLCTRGCLWIFQGEISGPLWGIAPLLWARHIAHFYCSLRVGFGGVGWPRPYQPFYGFPPIIKCSVGNGIDRSESLQRSNISKSNHFVYSLSHQPKNSHSGHYHKNSLRQMPKAVFK